MPTVDRGQVRSREQAANPVKFTFHCTYPCCGEGGTTADRAKHSGERTENDWSMLDTEIRGGSLKAHSRRKAGIRGRGGAGGSSDPAEGTAGAKVLRRHAMRAQWRESLAHQRCE